MMLIRVRVGLSEIHGRGLFAIGPIHKGTPVWKYSEECGDMRTMPHLIKDAEVQHYATFGYRPPGKDYIELPGDHACFWNHSDNPNVVYEGDQFEVMIADRDISPGEELTCDYTTFESRPMEWMVNIRGPKEIASPNFDTLVATMRRSVRSAAADRYWEDDSRQFIFEAAIEALYGKEFWRWKNQL
jgi:SET domain-containing protein